VLGRLVRFAEQRSIEGRGDSRFDSSLSSFVWDAEGFFCAQFRSVLHAIGALVSAWSELPQTRMSADSGRTNGNDVVLLLGNALYEERERVNSGFLHVAIVAVLVGLRGILGADAQSTERGHPRVEPPRYQRGRGDAAPLELYEIVTRSMYDLIQDLPSKVVDIAVEDELVGSTGDTQPVSAATSETQFLKMLKLLSRFLEEIQKLTRHPGVESTRWPEWWEFLEDRSHTSPQSVIDLREDRRQRLRSAIVVIWKSVLVDDVRFFESEQRADIREHIEWGFLNVDRQLPDNADVTDRIVRSASRVVAEPAESGESSQRVSERVVLCDALWGLLELLIKPVTVGSASENARVHVEAVFGGDNFVSLVRSVSAFRLERLVSSSPWDRAEGDPMQRELVSSRSALFRSLVERGELSEWSGLSAYLELWLVDVGVDAGIAYLGSKLSNYERWDAIISVLNRFYLFFPNGNALKEAMESWAARFPGDDPISLDHGRGVMKVCVGEAIVALRELSSEETLKSKLHLLMGGMLVSLGRSRGAHFGSEVSNLSGDALTFLLLYRWLNPECIEGGRYPECIVEGNLIPHGRPRGCDDEPSAERIITLAKMKLVAFACVGNPTAQLQLICISEAEVGAVTAAQIDRLAAGCPERLPSDSPDAFSLDQLHGVATNHFQPLPLLIATGHMTPDQVKTMKDAQVQDLSSKSITALLSVADLTEDQAKVVSPSVIGELPAERLKQLLRIRKRLTPEQMTEVKGNQVRSLNVEGDGGNRMCLLTSTVVNEFLMFLLSAVEPPKNGVAMVRREPEAGFGLRC